jgi:hypothetical protein
MNPKLKLLILGTLSVCFAAKRLGIRASVYLLAFFTALNVLAQNKVVTTGTVIDPGPASYEAVSGTAALWVSNAFYSGTHITLSSTFADGNARYGAYVQGSGTLALHDSVITSTVGVRVEHNASVFQFNDLTVQDAHIGINTNGIVTGTGLRVTATFQGIYQSSSRVEIERFAIDMSGGAGATGAVYNSLTVGGTMSLTSGTITVRADDDARGLLMLGNGMNAFLTDVHISTSASRNLGVDIYTDGGQTQNLVMRGGSIQTDGGEALHITGKGTVTVDLQDTDMAGDITATGSAHSTITLDHGTFTGGIIAGGSSALAVTGGNGAAISGTVSGNDHAAIDLTVSGPGGSFTGDLAQHDDATVTLAITDSAAGRGAWDGGNLNLDGGSQWDFTDHSRLNHGHNSGALNLGDYKVIFDNLTHTGTLNLHVNSDTGAGGTITVTDIADGEGTVHIDATGDGKADPNQVLPGKVTGDGTENWQWDPIDWGIDTIIKDGDHFVKKGTSPAGAVLNSSIAIQQAMWFAQQNSLLKRMGDLRYGARASRPLAGETPAFHNLIKNIWLRSYGQQLNVGSKVSGKAYEQLIYGVDLGTDHKFTISADSDLYLGVYAGYGRSDLDYRTPGTDGEINS